MGERFLCRLLFVQQTSEKQAQSGREISSHCSFPKSCQLGVLEYTGINNKHNINIHDYQYCVCATHMISRLFKVKPQKLSIHTYLAHLP